jgi:hypothetical protein
MGFIILKFFLLLLLTENSVRDEFQCQHIGSGSQPFCCVLVKKKREGSFVGW